MEQKVYLTAKEAAEYLRINLNTLYIMARNGVIPSIRPMKRKVIFNRNDLDNYYSMKRYNSDKEIISNR